MENGEAPAPIVEKNLKGKEKRFIEFYIGRCNMNGARAAREAGYSEKTAKEIASQLLRKPHIRKAIDERFKPDVATPTEILSILSYQAKGKITDLLDEDGKLDIDAARENGDDKLIKRLKITEFVDKEGAITQRRIDVEIHDPQVAAEKIGRFHKLFNEKDTPPIVGVYAMSKEEWEREAAGRLDQANSQLEKFHDDQTDSTEDPDTQGDANGSVFGSLLGNRD